MEARAPVKVVALFPEPTPYRAPLLDLVAAHEDVELLVAYAARTVAARTWQVEIRHPAVFLRGYRVPGARRLLRHEYPVTPGVVGLLRREDPDYVVVSGWSTFPSQVAILWCRLRGVPYLVVVESHDRDPRSRWRRMVKGAVVPRVVRNAAGVLVTGTLARESVLRRGADERRIRVFANTVDVHAFRARAEELRSRRGELRAALGLQPGDLAVLCVARLVAEKGLDTLLRAAAAAGDGGVIAVLAGGGPEAERLARLADELGVKVRFSGDLPWTRVVETYVACDVFMLLSRHEPWGVVVTEAAACGLPLVLSEHVGAAYDLLVDGENGSIVPPDDVEAAAAALRRLAGDPLLRAEQGARSQELALGWDYEASARGLLELLGRTPSGSRSA